MQGRISEQHRQGYLDAMGIQTWFPRQVLPNALPPREFDFPDEDEWTPASDSFESRHPEMAQDTSSMGVSQAKDLLGLNHAQDKKPEQQSTAPIVQVAATPKPETFVSVSKFRLVTLAPSDDCLVVAEMPHSGLNQFSRFHQRLLGDILQALMLNKQQASFGFSEFVWPLDNRGLMEYMSMDDTAAADAVCAYLSNQFGLARRKVVLLFGQAAARFVIDPHKRFEALRGIQTGLHSEQCFAVTHGLNELMRLPVLKAETWQDLSPLIARLPK